MTMTWLRAALLGALLLAPLPARAEPVFPPGAALGLEPPAGFAPSRAFSGFEAPDRSSIIIMAFPPQAFAEMRAALNAETLAARGLRETARRDLPLPGRDRPALLIEASMAPVAAQAPGGLTRWLLIVPDEALTGMVTVTVPGAATEAQRAAIERALASVAVRPRPDTAAQQAALPFTFAERPGLRFNMAIGGMAAGLFPPDTPVGTPQAAAHPAMIISAAPGTQGLPAGPLAAQAEAALRMVRGLREVQVTGAPEPARMGDVPAVLLRADAMGPDGRRVRVAQWLAVLPDGRMLVALAQAPVERFDAAWPDFAAVAETVQAR